MKTYKRACSTGIWILLALVLWEITSYILRNVVHDPLAEKKLPSIAEIGALFIRHGRELLEQTGITVFYAAAGFLIGTTVGIALALLMSLSRHFESMLLPYLLFSQMIPVLGLAPIIFSLVKDIALSRVVIAAYITFFPISVNLLSGLKSTEQSLLMMMRAYAAGKWQLYQKLLIPYSLPYLFTGMKISAPMAVTAAILVDTLSARDGIGYVIIFTLYGGGTVGQFWPAVILAALLGLLSFGVISIGEYFLVPWKRNTGEVKR